MRKYALIWGLMMAAGMMISCEEGEVINGGVSEEKNVDDPSKEPGDVEDPSKEPGDVEDPSKEPGDVEDPSKEPGDVEDPNKEPGDVEDPNKEPGDVEDPNKEPGDVEDPNPGSKDPADYEECKAPDSDGDTIADFYEGTEDTDGDTIPNAEDEDSDGDTIPDSVEGGTEGCSGTEPVDSDFDEIYDFLSLDSDSNGIPDSVEAGSDPSNPLDTDGDGYPDYADSDNDNDGIDDIYEMTGEVFVGAKDLSEDQFSGDCNGDTIPDTKGSPDAPIDCDSDGVADFNDLDSDGDTIPDAVESVVLNNGFYARYIKDSDGNGILDGEECGGSVDENGLYTNCIDTDNDGTPDYIDMDNDGDNLTDIYEISKGSDINKKDSDGDGVEDFVEIAVGTNPADVSDTPQAHGNFVFVVPYDGDSSPKKQSLSFATSVQSVDIYFSVDQSGSMGTEIKTLAKRIPSMIKTMQCQDLGKACAENKDCADLNGGKAICSIQNRCIVDPSIGADGDGCFVDMWTGYGGWGNINRFENRLSIQSDADTLASMIVKKGVGASENCIQPAAIVSGGMKYCDSKVSGSYSSCPNMNCYSGNDRVGCVGYRPDAIKILVQAGDEANSNQNDYTVANAHIAGKALRDNNIRFIGLWGSTSARDKGIKQIACEAGSCAAGSNCAADCQNISANELKGLFLAEIDDADIEQNTIKLVRKLAKNMSLHITSGVEDMDVPNVSKLIERLEINVTDANVQGRVCNKVTGDKAAPFEGINKLAPGTSVCYNVIPVEKQKLFKPTSEPQLFKAKVKVMGDGSVLNSGIAYFVVPPVLPEEQGQIN